jgi:hypothetical protein
MPKENNQNQLSASEIEFLELKYGHVVENLKRKLLENSLDAAEIKTLNEEYEKIRIRNFDEITFANFLLLSHDEVNVIISLKYEYDILSKIGIIGYSHFIEDNLARFIYYSKLDIDIKDGEIYFEKDLTKIYLQIENDDDNRLELILIDDVQLKYKYNQKKGKNEISKLKLNKLSYSDFLKKFIYTAKKSSISLFDNLDKTAFLLVRLLYRKASTLTHFDEVCEYLSTNLVHMSFAHDESKECVGKFMNKEVSAKLIEIKRSRNIAIIGAGASNSVLPEVFQLGSKTIDKIEEEIGLKQLLSNDKIRTKYNEKANHYKLKNGLNYLSFEERLFLLLHFYTEDEVRNTLQSLFDLKTVPVFFYEYIAHLFKNRFIDAVINFNFDEVLDQALEEEIGPGQFSTIISDGDCRKYESYINDYRLKVPLYIKPHGTMSNIGSMRFTKEHYLEIPQGVETLIEELFLGHALTPVKHEIKKDVEFSILNLYVFGFEMASIEFTEIIHRVAIEKINDPDFKINVFFFEYDVKEKNEKESKVLKKYVERLDHIGRINNSFKNIFVKIISLHEILEIRDNEMNLNIGFPKYLKCPLAFTIWHLQQKIENHFTAIYPLKKLTRHKLLIDIFSEKYNSNQSRDEIRSYFSGTEYYQKRLLFELVVVCLKNKGYIQVKESLNQKNRIGIYYELYKATFLKNKYNLSPLSIYDFLNTLCLNSKDVSFSDDLFCLQNNILDIIKRNGNEILNCGEIIREWEGIISKRWKIDRTRLDFDIKELFNALTANVSQLSSILYSDSVNIYPEFNSSINNLYYGITAAYIVTTNFSMMVNFRNMFLEETKQNKWNYLFMVGERGKNLVDAFEALSSFPEDERERIKPILKGKSIILILSSDTDLEKLKALCVMFDINLYVSFLPYYAHNRHLQIFTNINADNVNFEISSFKKAIFFYKKGFSNNINAYLLKQSSDKVKNDSYFNNCKQLMKTFCGMYIKSFSKKSFLDVNNHISLSYIRNESYIRNLKPNNFNKEHENDGKSENKKYDYKIEKLILNIYKKLNFS